MAEKATIIKDFDYIRTTEDQIKGVHFIKINQFSRF